MTTSGRRRTVIRINTQDGLALVKRVESCKFLGVYLDEKMTWKTHIEQITSKMSKTVGIISTIRHILPKYILHILYYTMIFPYLHYCNIVWASTYPSRLEKIVVLQKKIIRIISACKYRDHTSNYFKELHICLLYTSPSPRD